MSADHESTAPHAQFTCLSAGIVLVAIAASAMVYILLADVSDFQLSLARTLTTGALIAATVTWTASTGQTKTFCAAYAAAGWSYHLLAHSPITGMSVGGTPPYEQLLHVQIAIVIRDALQDFPTLGTRAELVSATFSLWFALFLSCIAGTLAVFGVYKPAQIVPAAWRVDWRVRFTLVEFLLLMLVLAPILSIWSLAGTSGAAYLAIWLGVGIAANRIANRLHLSVLQVLVPMLIGAFWGLAIAYSDGSLTSRSGDAVMHIVTGVAIGTACGLLAILSRRRALRETPRAIPASADFVPQQGVERTDSQTVS